MMNLVDKDAKFVADEWLLDASRIGPEAEVKVHGAMQHEDDKLNHESRKVC